MTALYKNRFCQSFLVLSGSTLYGMTPLGNPDHFIGAGTIFSLDIDVMIPEPSGLILGSLGLLGLSVQLWRKPRPIRAHNWLLNP